MKLSLQHTNGSYFRAIQRPIGIDFTKIPPGLYFVAGRNEAEPRVGANGAGKTSYFIDLFYWVLTGKTSRAQRPGSDIENWHSVKPTAGIIQIACDDAINCVARGRNPNFLSLNGDTIQQTELDALLPLTDAALRRTLLIDQFGQKFLDLRPEEKSRIFSETLNLDLWIQASRRADERLREAEGGLQRHEVDLRGIEAAIAEVRDQFEDAHNREKRFEKELEGKLAGLRKTRKEAARRSAEAEAALNLARVRGGESEADKERELNALKTERNKLQREEARNQATLQSEVRRVNSLTDKIAAYANTKTCPECGQAVPDKHVERRKKELAKELSEAQANVTQVKRVTSTFPTQLAKADKQIQKLEKDLIEFHKHLAVVSVAVERSQTALRELHSVDDQINTAKAEKNPFTKMCDDLEKRHKELKARRIKLKEEITILGRDAEVYRFWQKGYREIRLEQIDSTLLELELAANRHAESLGLEGWEIGFSTEREKSTGGISHAFTVLLYPPGQTEPVSWESYSGGESQRLQLAVTFGLAEVLLARAGIGTDFEVLDEPSVHLSSEGIDDLLECLRERASELNRRIFVIDHHALSTGSFDGVITCIKDKDGVRLEADGALAPAIQMSGRERVRL